ncbi:hypothetical protein GWK47_035151 [Chionoecetes opilio]|uniref:Uncharacterized protein n=1 Tax=Chionoecetes opilio TaxID=41210 RepID=A0A8J5CNR9_CHIOP|nr:hypothetical protein GWK47_035151 [Chionoecetes opilio]
MDNTYQMLSTNLALQWEVSPELFASTGNHLPLYCHLPTQLRVTSFGVSCSVRDVEEVGQVNSLLVEDCLLHACTTCKLPAAIWRRSLQRPAHLLHQRLRLVTRWTSSLLSTGCEAPRKPDLFCSYCPASVCGPCKLPEKVHCLSNGRVYGHVRLQTCQKQAIEEEPVAQQSDSESDVDDIEGVLIGHNSK